MRFRQTMGWLLVAAIGMLIFRLPAGGQARAGALIDSLADTPHLLMEITTDPAEAGRLCRLRSPQTRDLIALGVDGARAATAEFRRYPLEGGPERDLMLTCLAWVIEEVGYTPARPVLESFIQRTGDRPDLAQARAAARRLIQILPVEA